MATEAAWLIAKLTNQNLGTEKPFLTHTGLLMEGVGRIVRDQVFTCHFKSNVASQKLLGCPQSQSCVDADWAHPPVR
jgi:hypothetical protein